MAWTTCRDQAEAGAWHRTAKHTNHQGRPGHRAVAGCQGSGAWREARTDVAPELPPRVEMWNGREEKTGSVIPHPQHQSGKPPEKPAVYLGSVYLNSYSNPLSTAKAPSRMMVLSHTNNVTLGQDFKQLHKKKKPLGQLPFAATTLIALLYSHTGSLTLLGLVSAIWAIFSLVPGLFIALCLHCVPQCVLAWPPLTNMPSCIC